MESDTSTLYPLALAQANNHHRTLRDSLEHYHAQVAAIQEELINCQSQKIHSYEQRLQRQDLNIRDLEQEIGRLRGILTNIVDTVGPLNKQKAGPLDVISVPNLVKSGNIVVPLHINKKLPPRPTSIIPSSDLPITGINPLATEYQYSQIPPSTTRDTVATQKPPSLGFCNMFPEHASTQSIKSSNTTPPVSQSPEHPFQARFQIVKEPSLLSHTGVTNPVISSSFQKHHSSPLPLVHEAIVLNDTPLLPSPDLIAARAGNLPLHSLTPDEFFRRSSLSSLSPPKERFSSKIRNNSRLKEKGKEVEEKVEESDEAIRAKVREEARRRKKEVFGGVERVVRSSVVLSDLATPAAPVAKKMKSRIFRKDVLVSLVGLQNKRGEGVKKVGVIEKSSIVHLTLASSMSEIETGSINSDLTEDLGAEVGVELERIVGLGGLCEPVVVVVKDPQLEVLEEDKSNGSSNELLRDRIKSKARSRWTGVWG